MTWYKSAIFYELYPRAFYDTNGDGWGDFQGILQKADHLQSLGVDCIWLTPFYPSPLFDDGYDISDFYNIHPSYGTLDDFRALIEGMHERGIKVIADLVMNHTSEEHPWFIESRSSLDNPKRDWYVWSDTDTKYPDVRIIFIDTEKSNWTLDEKTNQYYWHRFFSQQPDLNFDNEEVQAEMLKIADFWMEFGLDGFRMDAVPYLYEREGTNGENLKETHDFLKQIRAHMDANWPGKILLCEANQWPDDVRPYFGENDEFHMGFHFPVMPRLYMALKQRSRASIVDIMNRTPAIPPDCQWCVFLRNHDELTLEMVTPEERDFMWKEYAPDPRQKLNLGIRRRLAPLMDNDLRRIMLLNAILMSLPGSPIIYYGDEIGMGDNIELRDRDGVRTPMQWDSSTNGGFSTAETTNKPVISDPVYGYQKVNVAIQESDPASLFNQLKQLIAIRKQQPAFGLGTFEFWLPGNEAVLGYWREHEGDNILVVANLSDQSQTITLPHANLTDLATGRTQWQTQLTLEPYAYFWFLA